MLERLAPSSADEQKVWAGMRLLREAKRMSVTSPAGTDLSSLKLLNTDSVVVPESLIRAFHDRGVPVG